LGARLSPPDSLIQLNDETAPRLQQFMKQVEAGCRIGLTLMRDVIFIWLIDKDGRIVLALEELVIDSRPLGVPKFQELSKAVAVLREKLGHPSLVQGEPARIAGEIRYLRATPTRTPLWIINNISWRYGLYEDRTEAQLKEVAAEFQRRGITLQAEFERPH
jgi:hypothetical protein